MTRGIHHITAIASDPQQTYDFYSDTLGLRLVKKSVNQDQVEAYHLFFGDTTGEPGMDLTFFTFQPSFPGAPGYGVVSRIGLAVRESALEFWQQRLKEKKVKAAPLQEQWERPVLEFSDQDNQALSLVGLPDTEYDQAAGEIWTTKEVTKEHAIASFHTATLAVISIGMIQPVLEHVLGYELVKREQQRSLFQAPDQPRAAFLEVEEEPNAEAALNATGTVHHIAFQVTDEQDLLAHRAKVLELGLYPTEVIDRYYFKSVYFRTPAGILFELATQGPGFTVDEAAETLGQELALPPFLENRRTEIEANLTPISTHE